MSYAIGLHIKKVNNAEEALNFISNFMTEMSKEEVLADWAEQNKYYIRSEYKACKELAEQLRTYFELFIKTLCAKDFIKQRFFYWPKYNLVGYLYMEAVIPGHLEELFDGYLFFQNSCDQDYDYSEWEALKDLVKPVIEQVNKEKADLSDYEKRTEVYTQVEYLLDIQEILENRLSDKYNYFCLSPNITDYSDLIKLLNKVVEEDIDMYG